MMGIDSEGVGMWTIQTEPLPHERGVKITIQRDARSATFAEIVRGWQRDATLRTLFNSQLADLPYAEFRWETPGVKVDSADGPFECVVLNAPGLARTPDPQAFAKHFAEADTGVAVFQNLGGDAILIAPRPLADSSVYGHLAMFVRHAPDSQRHTLWQAVGEAMSRRIGTQPVWLSTAGAGVPWLHVRLDDRPKYYGYGPYRT